MSLAFKPARVGETVSIITGKSHMQTGSTGPVGMFTTRDFKVIEATAKDFVIETGQRFCQISGKELL